MNGFIPVNEMEKIMNDLNFKQKKPRIKFTEEEDLKLRQLVEIIGEEDWQMISLQMPGRNSRQCRDRWKNYLAPEVVNGPWTDEEEELLVKKYEEFGPCWKRIAAFFPTRTDINVKSRWHLRERRIKKEEFKSRRLLLHKKNSPLYSPNLLNQCSLYSNCIKNQISNKALSNRNKEVNPNYGPLFIKQLGNSGNSQNLNSTINNIGFTNESSIDNFKSIHLIPMNKGAEEKNEKKDFSNNEKSNNDCLDFLLIDIENGILDDFDNLWF